ncbi:MAG: TorF family putative porin [Pseudobdellovibrionaceae bacterium]
MNCFRSIFKFKFTLFVILLTKSLSSFAQAPPAGAGGANQDQGSPNFKLTGEAELMSNYIHRGLTQTEKDPALQASFLFNFGPQFRMGLWGSNIGYKDTDTRFLLKANADILVNFSTNTKMKILVNNNNYFRPGGRNGWTYGLHFNFGRYKLLLESETNWQGTGSQLSYYALGYEDDISQTWKWPTQIGYSQIGADNYSNYFDVRTGIHYKSSVNIRYKLDLTWANNADQFDGLADYAFVLAAQTNF